MTETLITPFELRQRFVMGETTLLPILEAAGIKPAYQKRSGKNTIRFYPEARAVDAISKEVAKRSAAAVVPAAAVLKPEPGTTLVERLLVERLGQLYNLVDSQLTAAGEDSEKILEAQAKLQDQNAALLKAIDSVRGHVDQSMAALTSTILQAIARAVAHPTGNVVDLAKAKPPISLQAKLEEAKPKAKPRVAIISLLNAQREQVEKKFADCFDLRISRVEDSLNATKVVEHASGCDAIVVMEGYVSHGIVNTIKSSGIAMHRVKGRGMGALEDRLTALYIELTEKAKAA